MKVSFTFLHGSLMLFLPLRRCLLSLLSLCSFSSFSSVLRRPGPGEVLSRRVVGGVGVAGGGTRNTNTQRPSSLHTQCWQEECASPASPGGATGHYGTLQLPHVGSSRRSVSPASLQVALWHSASLLCWQQQECLPAGGTLRLPRVGSSRCASLASLPVALWHSAASSCWLTYSMLPSLFPCHLLVFWFVYQKPKLVEG